MPPAWLHGSGLPSEPMIGAVTPAPRRWRAPTRRASCVSAAALSAWLGRARREDVRPSRVTGIGAPIHTLCHVAMGMSVIDEMDLELVSQEAAKRNRWAFCMMAAPLRIPGGTSSVINPLALF